MQNAEPVFYFSLPRLLTRWRGGNAARTELNGREMNAVGLLMHGIAFLFAERMLAGGMAGWIQIALLLPLAILVWICWLGALYLIALLGKILRAVGLMRTLPNDRAQGILIGVMISVFAGVLLGQGSWPGVIGALWLVTAGMNLIAALCLAGTRNGIAQPK
ncbi:MAG: hypothetical protein ACR2NX_15680 [Chthoniobacterales bacterium]